MSEVVADASASPPKNEVSFDTARASVDDNGCSRPSSSAVCPCETTFRSSKQVLGAIHSDEATSSLITWLSDQNVREEGDDFVLIRGGSAAAASDGNPAQPLLHADNYGRCRARVGAAFAILNAIRDGCRSHLDRQQAIGAGSAAATQPASFGFGSGAVTQEGFPGAGAVTSTIASSPPSKPRYEDDFPTLGSASVSSSSAAISTKAPSGPANVLVPRKKKKKQPLPKQAGGATSAPNAVMKVVPAKQQKRRIRPVALSTSTVASTTSSPWPGAISSSSSSSFAAHVVKKGNIASLPSEDPINITKSPSRDRNAKTGEQKTPTPVRRPNTSNAMTTVGFSANVEGVSTPVLKPKVKKSALAPPGFGTVDNDSSSGAQISATPQPSNGPSIVGLPGQATPTPKESNGSANVEQNKAVKAMGALPTREADKATLGRLVDIYITLILNQLVPSVPLELHLLVRLLSLNVKAKGHLPPGESLDYEGDRDVGAVFRDVFCSAKSCRDFAAKVLTKIERPILSSLGEVILRKLIVLPSFKKNLPEVVGNLKRIMDDRGGILDKADPLEGAVAAISISGASNTPFLTVPFDEDRDSRHNYRSRDRTMLFNNREESRDKFMFQLRAFQEIRGTVLDPTQANVYISDIEIACREMIQGLLPGNFDWFSGLFTDLLLQIGLVAVEETDKDVLKQVADKDRLKVSKRDSFVLYCVCLFIIYIIAFSTCLKLL